MHVVSDERGLPATTLGKRCRFLWETECETSKLRVQVDGSYRIVNKEEFRQVCARQDEDVEELLDVTEWRVRDQAYVIQMEILMVDVWCDRPGLWLEVFHCVSSRLSAAICDCYTFRVTCNDCTCAKQIRTQNSFIKLSRANSQEHKIRLKESRWSWKAGYNKEPKANFLVARTYAGILIQTLG